MLSYDPSGFIASALKRTTRQSGSVGGHRVANDGLVQSLKIVDKGSIFININGQKVNKC